MATNITNSLNTAPFHESHELQAGQSTQNNPLLELPLDILRQIGLRVATGTTAVEAARNAINEGKVCALLHVLSHEAAIDKIIELGAKSPKNSIQANPKSDDVDVVDHIGNVTKCRHGARL